MSRNTERGARSGRGSALWGTGSRGGDRSSVLWGKGGRGLVVACMAVVALAAPLAAMADSGKDKPLTNGTWIDPGLLNQAGGNKVDVIVQSAAGTADANAKLVGLGVLQKDVQQLNLIGAVEATVPAGQLKKLQKVPGLTVTPNATMQVTGTVVPTSTQLWPYESGNSLLWPGDSTYFAGKDPAIAIVDSGIQTRSDFGNRILANVDLSTIPGNTASDPNASSDLNGHGTFVAGIAAGNAPGLAGAAPGAPIVAIKVMGADGTAKTSDIINACQWILDHKAQYNIRVANFSLHSSYATNFYRDPLDQAVEKLWFNGVVVVAAAGNYGTGSTPSGVLYSPGNDPYVITVGATDIGTSVSTADDTTAPWSAWGYTEDGFMKPEVSAPGRYMIGPIPPGSTLTQLKAQNMVGTDRIQLSGTSFAAPVVAGTVADMLARHPDWTPDQVKGALMRTARFLPNATPNSAGLGEITPPRAAWSVATPNPNAGLEQFESIANGVPTFNSAAWLAAVQANPAWNAISWSDLVSWSDVSWSDQAFAQVSWSDVSWSDVSWSDGVSWSDLSAADSAVEDAAEGDDTSNPADLAASTNPDIGVPVDGLDPTVALGVAGPSTSSSSSSSSSGTTTSSTSGSSSTGTSSGASSG